MKHLNIFLTVIIAALITGCVQSLYPLYTKDVLFFDSKLIGTWSEVKDNNTWTFSQLDSISYELIYTEKGVPAKFKAHLVKLGKYLFLDLYPEQLDIKNGFYKFHFIQAHTICRIWFKDNAVRLAILDQAWLKKMIVERGLRIRHERVDDNIILTALPRQLQRLVVRYAEDSKAFPNPIELQRQ